MKKSALIAVLILTLLPVLAFSAAEVRGVSVSPSCYTPGQLITVSFEVKGDAWLRIYGDILFSSNTTPDTGDYYVWNAGAAVDLALTGDHASSGDYQEMYNNNSATSDWHALSFVVRAPSAVSGMRYVMVNVAVNDYSLAQYYTRIESTAYTAVNQCAAGTPSSTATASPTFSATRTVTGTATRTATASATRTATPTATRTATPTGTRTATRSATATSTPSATATATRTVTGTATRSVTPTVTQTPAGTSTFTRTSTATATGTYTPTATTTFTHTRTAIPTMEGICGEPRIASPRLNLQVNVNSLSGQQQVFAVRIYNHENYPVRLSDLSVKVWLNESGAENMAGFSNGTGWVRPAGGSDQYVTGFQDGITRGSITACTTDPAHSANQYVVFGFGGSVEIPANGGYFYTQGDTLKFGRNNPAMDNNNWNDDYSVTAAGVWADSPYYALYYSGVLVNESADASGTPDSARGQVPCDIVCTPTSTVTGTSTATPTYTVTMTSTDTATPTVTPTVTQTATETVTQTVTQTVTETATPTYTSTNPDTPTATPTVTATATKGVCGAVEYVVAESGTAFNQDGTIFELINGSTGPAVLLITVFNDPNKPVTEISYGGVPAVLITSTGVANNAELKLYSIQNPLPGSNYLSVSTSAVDFTIVTAAIYENVSGIGAFDSNTVQGTGTVSINMATDKAGDAIIGLGAVRAHTNTMSWNPPLDTRLIRTLYTDRASGIADLLETQGSESYAVSFDNSSASSEVLSLIAVRLSANTYCITPTFSVTETSTDTATPTATPTGTDTVTPTVTGTFTDTQTFTPTFTATPTYTATPTATATTTNIPVFYLTVVIPKYEYIPGEQINVTLNGFAEYYAHSLSMSALSLFNADSANWENVVSDPTPTDSETQPTYHVDIFNIGDVINGGGPFTINMSGLAVAGKYRGYNSFILDFGMYCIGEYEYDGATRIIYVNTITPTVTETTVHTATSTVTETATHTPTSTATATITQTWTVSPTFTATMTHSETYTATDTATITPTGTVSSTPSVTPTDEDTPDPAFSRTFTPTATATGTASLTATRTVTATVTETGTPTATATITETASVTATRTVTATVTPTYTETEFITPTVTGTQTEVISPTVTGTHTITLTPADTATLSDTKTVTATRTITGTFTATPTVTETSTITPTRTATATVTPTGMPADEQAERLYYMFAVAVTHTAANFTGVLEDKYLTGPGFLIQNLSSKYDIELEKLTLRYWMKDEAFERGFGINDYMLDIRNGIKHTYLYETGFAGDPPVEFCNNRWVTENNTAGDFIGVTLASVSRSNQDLAMDVTFTAGLIPHNEYDCGSNPPSRSQPNNRVDIANISYFINDPDYYFNAGNDWSFTNDICSTSSGLHRAGLITVYYDGREILGQQPVITGQYELHVDAGGFGTGNEDADFKCDRPYNGGAWGAGSYYIVDYNDKTVPFYARLTPTANMTLYKNDSMPLSVTNPAVDSVYRSVVRAYRYKTAGRVDNDNPNNFARDVYQTWRDCEEFYGDDYFQINVNQQVIYIFENLPKGEYEVTLRFIELDPMVANTRDSIVNVYLNGVLAVSNLDVYAIKNLYTEHIEVKNAWVTNGRLQLTYELAKDTKYQAPRGTLAGISLKLKDGTFTGMPSKWNCTLPIEAYSPEKPYMNPIYDTCGDYEVPIPTFTVTPTVTPTKTMCPGSPTPTATRTMTPTKTATLPCVLPDSYFNGGKKLLQGGEFYTVSVYKNEGNTEDFGKTIAAGSYNSKPVVVRFDRYGNLDSGNFDLGTAGNGDGIVELRDGMYARFLDIDYSTGDIYIVGTVDNVVSSSSGIDTILVKLDSEGKIIYETLIDEAIASKVKIGPDGSVFIVGNYILGYGYAAGMWKIKSDGTRDIGFGNNGMVTPGYSNSGAADIAFKEINSSQIEIYLAGYVHPDIYLWKYDYAGNPDNAFGTVTGTNYIKAVFAQNSFSKNVLVNYAGDLYVVGYTGSTTGGGYDIVVMKLGAGNLDTIYSYDSGMFDYAYAASFDSCGSVLMAGWSDADYYSYTARMTLWRILPDGTPDSSFGVNGIIKDMELSSAKAYDADIGSDGRIVTAGYANVNDVRYASIWSYNDLCVCATPTPTACVQTWQNVGTPGFSEGAAGYVTIDGFRNAYGFVPYVGFNDYAFDSKARVMKYEGNSWVDVGSPGFTDGATNYTDLKVFDDSGNPVPYMGYCDLVDGNKVKVMRFNGTAWELVGGTAVSSGYGGAVALYVYSDNGIPVPFVAFVDVYNGNSVTVMKYQDDSWQTVGNTGFASNAYGYMSLSVVNSNGTSIPMVAFQDTNNDWKATVIKYESGTWVTLGNPGFSDYGASYLSLKVHTENLQVIPYLAYSDGGRVTVVRYFNNLWEPVGDKRFSSSEGIANFVSLTLLESGSDVMPVVVYQDNALGGVAMVKKFDGTVWQSLGEAGISSPGTNSTKIISDQMIPYVAFGDGDAASHKISVMKYDCQ